MVNYKPKWWPEKTANLTQTAHPLGTYDKILFTPAEDIKLRCFNCNVLLESGILSTEGACVRCNKRFTKKEVADMFVEAKQVQTVPDEKGRYGWTVERLAELYRRDHPGAIRPDDTAKALTDRERKLAEFSLRQKNAKMKVVRTIRNSPLSSLLGSNPEFHTKMKDKL